MKIISFIIILFFFSACNFSLDNLFIKQVKAQKTYKSPQKLEKPQNDNIIHKNAKIKTQLEPIKTKEIKKEQTTQIAKQTKLENKITFKKIAFIGDSHLASDYIQDYFRKTLKIKSLGFIPPILPKWHNQYLISYKNKGFNVEYLINTKNNLSFGGINANCPKNCEFDIDLAFNASDLKYLEFESGIWKIKNYKSNVKNINLSVSNTKIGGFLSNNSSYIDNLGINGASIFNYSRINDELLKSIAKKLDYDLVIFSFGTNESVLNKINEEMFINNYLKIINYFKNSHTKIVLLIPPEPTLYINKNYTKGESNELVKTLIKQVAKTSGVYIFDIDNLMQKEGGKIAWINDKKSLKNTHLTKLGYEYVAFKLLEFLSITKE